MYKTLGLTVGVLHYINLVAGVDVVKLDQEAGSLQYVHVLHRNGECSIEKGYKLDPYSEEKFWAEGLGKLTSQGILNQYRLGQFLGDRYSSLISNRKYNRKQYQPYSAPKEENYLSAMAVSQGMYQNSWSDALNDNMKWIPVNVLQDNTLQLDGFQCPVYEESKRVFRGSREYQTLRTKYEEVLKGAANYTGVEDKDIKMTDLPKLWNHFVVESNYKLALHDWAKNVYPKTMQEPVSIAYIIPTWTTELKKAVTGRFWNSLLDTLSKKVNGSETERNITAISTNDFTISAVLDVLGVFNSMPVPFDSTIMIELRKLEENNLTITILYSNETITEGKPERHVHLLKMPNCTEVCPLDKFKEQISPYLIEDWDLFCRDGNLTSINGNGPHTSRGDCNKFGWLQITVPVAVGAVVILVVITVCKKMQTKGTIVMNNPQKVNRNQTVPNSNESAAFFVASLSEMPSLFTDPVGGWMGPYDIFTLPPPFIPPPEMMMTM